MATITAATADHVGSRLVAPGFETVVARFERLFPAGRPGGGALAVRWKGQPVLDIWAGTRDRAGQRAWEADTSAMSFSTSKGVTSAVVHRMVDRHELDLDRPVAAYWPAFAAHGKGHVTLRQVLTHQAGLHNVRDLVDDANDLLVDEEMEARLAAAVPEPLPGTGPGYHGMTFGWLLSGVVRAVTGQDMASAWRRELGDELGLDGLRLGIDAPDRADVAELLAAGFDVMGLLGRVAGVTKWSRRAADALVVPGFNDLLVHPDQAILGAQMPAVTGVFTARALATLYSGLGSGEVDGHRVLSEPAANRLRIVQVTGRDYVMGIPMRWRLGYHQAFMRSRFAPRQAFGHYGFGGSGGWVDPVSDLAMGFVTNRLGTTVTPVADPRLFGLSGQVVAAARQAPAPPS